LKQHPKREVTEIAGEIVSGKTQLSNTLYRRSDRNSWRNIKTISPAISVTSPV
jgi:hypothetical protein